MQRTTVMIPFELKIKALERARQMGLSFGELIRLGLKKMVQTTIDLGVDDPLFIDKSTFTHQAPKDLSTNHDEYLYGDDK